MDIDDSLVPILENIDFSDRYSAICNKYSDFNNSMSNINIDTVIEIVYSENKMFKFKKSECFFKLIDKFDIYTFQFNIVIKSKYMQFIWDLKKNGERLKLGWGMWEDIVENLTGKEFYIQPRPFFSNYEDLREILKEAFSIYEDFKREVIKEYGNEK